MRFFSFEKVYKTSMDKADIKEKLLNSKVEASGYSYSFEEIENDVLIANPQKEISLYHNSCVPQIVATILENGDVKVEFKLTKFARFLLIFLNCDAVLLGIAILFFMLYRGVFEWTVLIPWGVLLFSILLSTIGLRVCSKKVKKELENIIK